MTIKVFSPKWFFQDQLSIEDQETTKELFSDFLNNDDNFLNPKGWNCAVKISWGHEIIHIELWQSWLKMYQTNYGQICATCRYKM